MSEQNPDQSKQIIFCNDPASPLAVSSYYFFLRNATRSPWKRFINHFIHHRFGESVTRKETSVLSNPT
jgi:hypothetical protein